jgi:hypothetical protein
MPALFARHWRIVVFVSVLSLCLVGVISSSAQSSHVGQRAPGSRPLLTEAPLIVAGDDVGFRIERTANGIPVGRVVVRIDGRWVDTQMSTSLDGR